MFPLEKKLESLGIPKLKIPTVRLPKKFQISTFRMPKKFEIFWDFWLRKKLSLPQFEPYITFFYMRAILYYCELYAAILL